MEKGSSSSSRASPPGGGRAEGAGGRRLRERQTLGLRLLGFLDSRTETALDAAFIAPIRADVCSKIDAARRSLAPESIGNGG
ncbi:unnamed protein product [Spirodela intermedia]|uniref:FIGL1 N-terminal domain-containing protein n=1 Tax=Spirodela intermedia TaxID=51605 RepID=A0A7I8J3V2_SPIIN|nr:unnamed protein product [Spirodela intermedia]CAA6664061.1 unnamed protein product [Spirodela intermedia]